MDEVDRMLCLTTGPRERLAYAAALHVATALGVPSCGRALPLGIMCLSTGLIAASFAA